jgi:hypothetical protein
MAQGGSSVLLGASPMFRWADDGKTFTPRGGPRADGATSATRNDAPARGAEAPIFPVRLWTVVTRVTIANIARLRIRVAKTLALADRVPKAVLGASAFLTEGGNVMGTRIRIARSIAWPALFAGMLLGCNGSGGTFEVGVTSSGQPLTIAAPLAGAIDIDAGTAGPRLLLTVQRVDVHIAGDDDSDDDPPAPPGGPPPHDNVKGGWITVFTGVAQIDLLRAGSVETFLGSAVVPAGKVTQIRLVISEAIFVDGAVTKPVACSSCTRTGLKIVTMGKLFVPHGGTLHVTLDFDRDSLKTDKDGYRLDPVVKIARSSVR